MYKNDKAADGAAKNETAAAAEPKTAIAKIEISAQGQALLATVDTAGMTDGQKAELAKVMEESYADSRTGFDFKPQRVKVNKDSQTFADPFGNAVDELRGIMIFKQKVRALWDRKSGENAPLCSSLDCVIGTRRDGTTQACVGCPANEWGSGKSEGGQEMRGKACKEMRRIYLLQLGNLLPVLVTLPPTSIKPWDDYCSARLTQKLTDLSAEVIMRLVPGKAGGYTFSVIQPKVGSRIPAAELLRYNDIRKQFVSSWEKAAVTDDDYSADDGDEAPKPKEGDAF